MKKTYIGDGVYAEVNELGLILTVEDGVSTHQTVVLGDRELTTLVRILFDKFPKLKQECTL